MPAERRVEVQGRVACTRGFLEQVACGRGSREHESLLVIEAPASVVHAGLLAIGLRSGHPGRWFNLPDGRVQLEPPEGDEVTVRVRWSLGGLEQEVPVQAWVRGMAAVDARWVFAGSRFGTWNGVESYAADGSGSVVGLVTFGDEVVALHQVVPDRASVRAPVLRADTDAMPPEGHPVTLILGAKP
jgi:hypothetical protein